jgi:nitroimidazol reductase NimA-like FMN-containing flavoprotein (pyridoxamine 5'-phosphate oxidase superfamily)
MSRAEIEDLLDGSHQAVLSVSRDGRGPVAVPMSYLFVKGQFRIITPRNSLHGRLMQQTGRATLTIHHEEYPHRGVRQRYVMAEGPIEFTDDDPAPLVRALLAKDRGEALADEWTRRMSAHAATVAVLTPSSLNGYTFAGHLD